LPLLVPVGWKVSRPPAVLVAWPGEGSGSPARWKETLSSENTITTIAPMTPNSTKLWYRSRWPIVSDAVLNPSAPLLIAPVISGTASISPAPTQTK